MTPAALRWFVRGALALPVACAPRSPAPPAAAERVASRAPSEAGTPWATEAPDAGAIVDAAPTEAPPRQVVYVAPGQKPDRRRIDAAIAEGLKNAAKCEVDRACRGRTFP